MDTGTKTAGALVSSGNWTIALSNVTASDNTRATLSWASSPSPFVLSTFGFNIPSGSTINGIEVVIEGRCESANETARIDTEVSWNNGTNWSSVKQGTNKTTTTDSNETYGGASDLWGHSWVGSELSDANFQLRITGNTISTFGDSGVDYVTVKIYYTPPTLEQEGFRFRNDNGSETSATWRDLQDTNITETRAVNVRLRVLINATLDPPYKQFQLEYRKKGTGEAWKKIE